LRSEPWEGASKASRGPRQAVLDGVEEGKARRTTGKSAEATSEALENVRIGNESRWVLCVQQAADLFSRSLFSAGP
jgi:hypothetical protein